MYDDQNHSLTLRDRWDRIWAAITHPFSTSPLSPEGKIGISDYYWAWQMFFVGFAKKDPEQAGKCFFYTIMLLKLIVVLHILAWIF